MNRWTTASRTFRTFLLVAQLDPGAIQARIRQARTEAGLTQQELADLIERHKRTVENYENVRVPDFAELNKIARVLNRRVEWFLHGDGAVAQGEELDEIRDELASLRRAIEALDRKLDVADLDQRLKLIEAELRAIRSDVASGR